jgi:hypothetical protein
MPIKRTELTGIGFAVDSATRAKVAIPRVNFMVELKAGSKRYNPEEGVSTEPSAQFLYHFLVNNTVKHHHTAHVSH